MLEGGEILRVHGLILDGTIKKTEQDIKVWCVYISELI